MFKFFEDFNPHHHAGGDLGNNFSNNHNYDFNPHHHAGGDKTVIDHKALNYDFNPHHHAGGDFEADIQLSDIMISIHTTTQVVTERMKIAMSLAEISIHTTTQVVTNLASQSLYS